MLFIHFNNFINEQKKFKTVQILKVLSLFILKTCFVRKLKCHNNVETKYVYSHHYINLEKFRIKQHSLNIFSNFISRNWIEIN